MTGRILALGLLVLLAGTGHVFGQAAYPLKVHDELPPKATLHWEGRTAVRSKVEHDPGFDLVFHVQHDGKTVARVKARPVDRTPIEAKQPGKYTVVLEAFFPGYKPSTKETKGAYKPISNVIELNVPAPEPPEG